MKILIVDDKKENLYFLQTLLKSEGHEVISAENGKVALEKLKQERCDMIISDILMPVMDGYQLCFHVKHDEKLNNIPFIFYTATYTEPRDKELALEMGADRYIQKPIDPEEFIKIINKVIEDTQQGKFLSDSKAGTMIERDLFNLYNERIIQKFDKKLLQLEKTENELRKATDLLQETEEITKTGGWQYDVSSKTISWTDEVYRIYGVKKEEYDPNDVRSDISFYVGDDEKRIEKAFTEALEQGKPYELELQFKKADGRKIWVCTSGKPVVENGIITKIIGHITDITERKQAEEALKEREAKYRTIFATSSNAIFLMKDDRFIDCNSRTLKIFNCKREDIINQTPYDTFSPKKQPDGRDSKEKALEKIKKAFESKPQRFEWVHCTLDGKEFITEVSLNRYEIDGEMFLMAVVQDITDRKIAEERYTKLVSTLPVGIFRSTPEGKILSANPATATIYGFDSIQEVLETPAEDFYEDKKSREAMLARIEKEDVLIDYVTLDRKKDGTPIWVSTNYHAVRDKDGKITYLDGVVVDITERKQTEEKLLLSEERMRLANKATNDAIWDWDIVNDKQMWNESGTVAFGWKDIVEQPQSASWWVERVHEDDRKRVEKGFFDVVNDPENNQWRDEYRFRKADGSYAQVIDRGYVLRDTKGKAIRMIGAMQDITERKQSEEQLRESEENYRNLFESTIDGMMVIDQASMEIVLANQRIIDMYKIQPEQMKNLNFFNFVAPEDQERLKKIIMHDMFKKDLRKINEFLTYTADKETLWISAVGTKIDYHGKPAGLISIRDITSRKQAEEALKISEDKFKYIFDHSIVGKSLTYPTGELHVNKAFCDMLGYTQEELEGPKWQEITHPDDIEMSQKEVNAILAGEKEAARWEKRYVHKNGSTVWVDLSTSLRRTTEGKPLYFITAVLDITEQKQTSLALQESEENLRQLTENIDQVFWLTDWETRKLLYVSPSYEQVFGRSIKSAYEKLMSWEEAIHPDDYKRIAKLYAESATEEKYVEAEYRIKTPDGKVKWIFDRSYPIKDINGKVYRFVSIAEDITHRKQAEAEYKQLIEGMHETTFVINFDGKFIDVNNSAIKVLGYTREELLSMGPTDIDPMMSANDISTLMKSIKKDKHQLFETQHQTKDGKIFPVEISSSLIEYQGEEVILCVVRDISKRKKTEQALVDSEARFSAFMDTMPITTFIKDKDQKLLYYNKEMRKIFKAKDWIGKTPFDIFPHDVAKELVDADNEAMEKEYGVHVHEVPDKKGKVRVWETHTFRIDRKDQDPLLGGFSLDITVRKKNEELIRKRSHFQKIRAELWKIASSSATTESELIQDMLEEVGKALDISRATFLRLHPSQHKFMVENQWFQKGVGPSDNRSISVAKAKLLFGHEYVVLPRDLVPGLKQYVTRKFKKDNIYSYLAMPYGDPKNPKGLFTYTECREARDWEQVEIDALKELVNIISYKSEQIKVLQAIQESEVRLAEAQKLGKIGSWEFDVRSGEITWSNQTYEMYERNPSLGPPSPEEEAIYYTPEQTKRLRNYAVEAIETGTSFEYDLILNTPSGKTVYCAATMQPVTEKGVVVKLRGTVQDITKRKKAEKELEVSEKKYRDIITLAPVGFYQSTRDGKFIIANETLAEMLGYENINELINTRSIKNIYYDEGEREKLIEEYDEEGDGRVFNVEVKYKKKDGSPIWVLLTSQAYRDEQGNTIYYDGFVIDISELKAAEEKIKRELKEKDVLLQEVHHRVKNNLQTISGLLQLQQDTIVTKEDALKGFQVSQDRILAMAKAYELLLDSRYMSEVSVGKYITSIVYQLKNNYDNEDRVDVGFDLEEVYIDTERLGKIGLIVNEIITNAMKYAFEGRKESEIIITLTQKEDTFTLHIADNGVGIPENVKTSGAETLGLSLIEMLATELKASLHVDRAHGTTFVLMFPLRYESPKF